MMGFDENNAREVERAMDAGWLPDGWRMDGDVLVVPDFVPGRMRGRSTALDRFREIRTESGRLIKSPRPNPEV